MDAELEEQDVLQLQMLQGSSSSSSSRSSSSNSNSRTSSRTSSSTSSFTSIAPTTVALPILYHDSSSRGVDELRNQPREDAKVSLGWLSTPLTRRVVTEYKKILVPGDKLYYDSSINSL